MATRDNLGFKMTATAREHRPTPEPTAMHVAYARIERQLRYYEWKSKHATCA